MKMKDTPEIMNLKSELEQEIKFRDKMIADNRNLESTISKLERELQFIKKQDPNLNPPNPSCDGYQRWQAQLKANHKLEKDIALETERLRILKDAETDITDLNLDNLSQAELVRIVKQLERMKTDLISSLNDTEHQLDVQAKEFHKLNETRKLYQAELELRERSKGGRRLERHGGSVEHMSSMHRR
ncbi:uncharacterized protein LOC128990808 [Macrosteles quadrilineatus]|uniref:uncharacterized protein LOC128990808 n=1 Tax=Macrosteles quadrilineatus TaxID=74068 RepID=UPI0023E2328B|nr:uncharacterized protein LOC128990808 [Macrosteles quadrilineatus]